MNSEYATNTNGQYAIGELIFLLTFPVPPFPESSHLQVVPSEIR